jgi:hypothetical protein
VIERALHEVITSGLLYLRDNPGTLKAFFEADELMDAGEAEKVEVWFQDQIGARLEAKEDLRPVRLGYPQPGFKPPIICITLVGDQTGTRFIGDEGQTIGDADDPDRGTDSFASMVNLSHGILVAATQVDPCIYLYEIVKQCLINAYPILKGSPYFLSDMAWSGSDVAPDKQWEPTTLYVRRLSFTSVRECIQDWPSSKVGKAWKVRAIHVDKAGAPGESVGGVLTHVTVPGDGEE